MKFTPIAIPTDPSLLLPRLRTLLDDTERQIIGMRTSSPVAVQVIQQIDELMRLHAEAQRLRLDARGEEARLDALRLRVLRHAPELVRRIPAAGLEPQLAAFAFWQTVQHEAQQRAQANLRRLITWSGTLGAVAILLFVVIPWIFPPTPIADTMGVIERVQSGNLAEALAFAEAQRREVPTDADNLVWIGVLHERMGNLQAAEEPWAEARRLLNDDLVFAFERSNTRLLVGDDRGAEADARVLIASSQPRLQGRGYMLLAGIEETRGRRSEALLAYDQAFQLAEQANDAELQVMVRIRMGTLMQAPEPFPTPTP